MKTQERISMAEQRAFFDQAARKACDWNEVPVAEGMAGQRLAEAAEGLPVLDQACIYRGDEDAPHNEMAVETPQWFVLRHQDGRRFLVNTEGYGYARYVLRIQGGAR